MVHHRRLLVLPLLAVAHGLLSPHCPRGPRGRPAPRSFPLQLLMSTGSGKDVGKILGPGPAGAWDDYKVSGPVVRADPGGAGWNMFYYGRSKAFNQTADLSA